MNSPLNTLLGVPVDRQRCCKHQCSNCGGTIIRSGKCESCGHDVVAITCFDGTDWHSYAGAISTYYAGEQEASRIVEQYSSFGVPADLPPFFGAHELLSLHEYYNLVESALVAPGWFRNDSATVIVYGAIEADVVLSVKRKRTTVTFVNTLSSKLSPISFCQSVPNNEDGQSDYKRHIKSNSRLLVMDPGHQLSVWLEVIDGLGNKNRLNIVLNNPIVTVIQHSLLSSGQDKNSYQVNGRVWGQIDVSQ
jgi:hypothetical protein